jgi:hypothetical protein
VVLDDVVLDDVVLDDVVLDDVVLNTVAFDAVALWGAREQTPSSARSTRMNWLRSATGSDVLKLTSRHTAAGCVLLEQQLRNWGYGTIVVFAAVWLDTLDAEQW